MTADLRTRAYQMLDDLPATYGVGLLTLCCNGPVIGQLTAADLRMALDLDQVAAADVIAALRGCGAVRPS